MDIRRPPEGYVFKEDNYRSDLFPDFGSTLKPWYPELNGWDSGSIAQAWKDFTEATTYAVLTIGEGKSDDRDADFLAYLFAEQELRPRGLMLSRDGVPFTYYLLEMLGPFWEDYDLEIEDEASKSSS